MSSLKEVSRHHHHPYQTGSPFWPGGRHFIESLANTGNTLRNGEDSVPDWVADLSKRRFTDNPKYLNSSLAESREVDVANVEVPEAHTAKVRKRHPVREKITGAAMAALSVLGLTGCENWIVGLEKRADLPNPPAYQLYRGRPEVYTALGNLSYEETIQARDAITNASVSVARHNAQTGDWDMGGGIIIKTVNNPAIIGVATAGHLFTDDALGGQMTPGEMRNYDAVSIWPRSNSANPLPEFDGIRVAVALPKDVQLIAGTQTDVAVVYPPFAEEDGKAFQRAFNGVALPLRRTKINAATTLFRIPFHTGVTHELIPLKLIGEYEGMYVTEDDLVYNPAIQRCDNGDSGGAIVSVERKGGRLVVEVAGIYVSANHSQCFASPVFLGSSLWNPATAMG